MGRRLGAVKAPSPVSAGTPITPRAECNSSRIVSASHGRYGRKRGEQRARRMSSVIQGTSPEVVACCELAEAKWKKLSCEAGSVFFL